MRRGWGGEKWREGKTISLTHTVVSSSPTAMGAGGVHTHIHTPTQLPSNNRQLQKGKKITRNIKNKKEVNPSHRYTVFLWAHGQRQVLWADYREGKSEGGGENNKRRQRNKEWMLLGGGQRGRWWKNVGGLCTYAYLSLDVFWTRLVWGTIFSF